MNAGSRIVQRRRRTPVPDDSADQGAVSSKDLFDAGNGLRQRRRRTPVPDDSAAESASKSTDLFDAGDGLEQRRRKPAVDHGASDEKAALNAIFNAGSRFAHRHRQMAAPDDSAAEGSAHPKDLIGNNQDHHLRFSDDRSDSSDNKPVKLDASNRIGDRRRRTLSSDHGSAARKTDIAASVAGQSEAGRAATSLQPGLHVKETLDAFTLKRIRAMLEDERPTGDGAQTSKARQAATGLELSAADLEMERIYYAEWSKDQQVPRVLNPMKGVACPPKGGKCAVPLEAQSGSEVGERPPSSSRV
jgi:hypothetical protein